MSVTLRKHGVSLKRDMCYQKRTDRAQYKAIYLHRNMALYLLSGSRDKKYSEGF